ncbi:MAG: hypothetical protein B7Z37_11635 [Verrucomicrobia bacterium 12-59-8]|nr:MAG: hypothetical protein B7Z37_11635 [Verrucomicrobia bacterium 12-59-8]
MLAGSLPFHCQSCALSDPSKDQFMGALSKILKSLVPQSLRAKAKGWIRVQVQSALREERHRGKTDWRKHSQVCIGRHTYGIVHESIPLMESRNWKLEVGSFCSIAPAVRFVFGKHHQIEGPTTFPVREYVRNHWDKDSWEHESIRVGHDVWIASNSLILSGVTIGHGAVIGAGSVVVRDIPPFAVAAGVPARVLRWRMPAEQQAKMLEIAWWAWPDEKILANEDLLYGDLDAFIAAHWPPAKTEPPASSVSP